MGKKLLKQTPAKILGLTAGRSGPKAPLPVKSEQARDNATVVKALQTLAVHYR